MSSKMDMSILQADGFGLNAHSDLGGYSVSRLESELRSQDVSLQGLSAAKFIFERTLGLAQEGSKACQLDLPSACHAVNAFEYQQERQLKTVLALHKLEPGNHHLTPERIERLEHYVAVRNDEFARYSDAKTKENPLDKHLPQAVVMEQFSNRYIKQPQFVMDNYTPQHFPKHSFGVPKEQDGLSIKGDLELFLENAESKPEPISAFFKSKGFADAGSPVQPDNSAGQSMLKGKGMSL